MPRDTSSDSRDRRFRLSRRAILGGATAIGVVGVTEIAGSVAPFRDGELFGSDGPNSLEAGSLDLEVGWTGRYYDGTANSPRTLAREPATDRSGPVVEFEDVKPGDVVEGTLRARVLDAPAFLGTHFQTHSNLDAGISGPEDEVDGALPNDSDGTPGGDLPDAINCVCWYDGSQNARRGEESEDGEGHDGSRDEFLGEIWTGTADVTDTTSFLEELGGTSRPSDVFDTDAELLVHSGTLADLSDRFTTLDAQVQGGTPDAFPDSWCYDADATQRLGALCWIPRVLPGTNDNVIQTDRLAYQFGVNAIQCRHNVAPGGGPVEPPGGSPESGQLENGSFEDGFRGWTVGQDLPRDPNDPGEFVDASATVSAEKASNGSRSAEFFIDGVADEGTIWVQQLVDFTGVDAVAVDFFSRGVSGNVITRAAVYWGPVPEPSGLTERHFDTSRPVEDHSGWETYEYPISYDGRGLVAAGISVVWEGPATRFVDNVRLR